MRVPEFLARFNGSAARVTVKEGETATVEAKVISREALRRAYAELP
jgi:hypothetical protein